MYGATISKLYGVRFSKTLLDIKNEDTYGEAEARAIVATLYDEYRYNASAFHALGLDDIAVTLDNGVHVHIPERHQEHGKPVFATGFATGFDRLVALADALHATGDLRIAFANGGEGAAREALEAYAHHGQVAPPWTSALLARHTAEATRVIDGLSLKAGNYCRVSLRRIRDVYALSTLLPDRDRPILDMVMAVLLETSHRVDDYYDNDAKWHTYGYQGPGEAISEGLLAVEQLLAGKPYQAEAMTQAEALLAYLEIWVGGDSQASELDLSDATQRIIECNADLYRRFFDIYSLGTEADGKLRPIFESFGALIWVLDDWRDVEADSLNDHFNVFTPFQMDVRTQVAHLTEYFEILLDRPLRMLDEDQIDELLRSAGATEVMKRYLGL